MAWTISQSFSAPAAPAVNTIFLALVAATTGVIDATIRNYQSGANGVTIETNASGEYNLVFTGMPDGAAAAGVKIILYTGTITTNTVTGWLGSFVFTPLDESQAKIGAASGLLIAGSNAATTFATLTSTGAFTINGTSNVAQTGDGFAYLGTNLGALGANATALAPSATALSTVVWTGTIAGRIDAAVSSRMATYAQPTGFLAATFPSGTIASTTNITAGTMTTTTNLTNAATAGDFTATMKTSLNAATPASVVGAIGSVTGNVGGNVVGSVGSISGVTFPSGFSTLTSGGIATSVWTDTTAGDFATSGSIGKSLFTGGAIPGSVGGLAGYSDVARFAFRTLGSVWCVAGGISNVAAPTITQHGTPGSTTYIYQVTALNASGHTLGYAGTAGNGAVTNALGNATLNSSNYNIVTWAAIDGATGYTVWKWTGSAWGTVSINQAGVVYNDQGGSISAGSIPTTNTTSSGNDSNAGTASAPFATIAHAISVASIGDTIFLGDGYFCIGTGNVNMPDFVSLVGAGMDQAFVVADTLIASGAIVKPGSYATTSDMTIISTAAYAGSSNQSSAPIGSRSSAGQSAIVGATIERVKTIGDSNGLYVNQQSATVLTQYQAVNCIFESKGDGVTNVLSALSGVNGNLIDLNNCRVVAVGPGTISGGATARGFALTAGAAIVNISGGSYEATGALNDNDGISNESSNANAIVSLYQTQINTGVAGVDLLVNNGQINVFGPSSYNPGTSTVEGTGSINLLSPPMSNSATSPNDATAQQTIATLAPLVFLAGTQGTAQAGSANTITLSASPAFPDGTFAGQVVVLTNGTGFGQIGLCTTFISGVATMSANWRTPPDATTMYLWFGIPTPVEPGGTIDANIVKINGHSQTTDSSNRLVVSPNGIPPVVTATVSPSVTVRPGP